MNLEATQTKPKAILLEGDLYDIVNEAFFDCTTDYFNEINKEIVRISTIYQGGKDGLFEFLKDLTYKLECTTDDYTIEELIKINYVPQYDYIDMDISEYYEDYNDLVNDLEDLQEQGFITNLDIQSVSNGYILLNFHFPGALCMPIEVFNTKMETLYNVANYFHNW